MSRPSIDPTWTAEQALEADERFRNEAPAGSFLDRETPFFVWEAMQRLDQKRAEYDAGDRMALMAALRICANFDLVMPEWVATNYIRAYDETLNCRSNSWDDVFGRPYPKGKHLAARWKRRNNRFTVLKRFNEMRAEGRAADDQLYAEIGTEFGLCKTLVKELINDVKWMRVDYRKK